MWVLGTVREGKVIAGIQLMVVALVGLPQLLLDCALTRYPPRRLTNLATESRFSGDSRRSTHSGDLDSFGLERSRPKTGRKLRARR